MTTDTEGRRSGPAKTIAHYPAGGPDWATISRWEDAGRPTLEPDGSWFTLVDRPALDDAELDAIGAAETQRTGLCGRVRPGTLGYQRCWRLPDHDLPHLSQDGQAWISSSDVPEPESAARTNDAKEESNG